MSEKGPGAGAFEDLGDLGDDDDINIDDADLEKPAVDEVQEDGDSAPPAAASPQPPRKEPKPLAPPVAPAPPVASPPPPKTSPPPPVAPVDDTSESRPWPEDIPEEVIEKRYGEDHSNLTIQEADRAGTLKADVNYRTKKGGFFTNFFGISVKLTERQREKMKNDAAYREQVYRKGP